jgi:hypothetical protein
LETTRREEMRITKDMLRTDLPPIKELEDGRTNVVLAFWKDNVYCDTNTYLSQWTVSNTAYYNINSHAFLGWVELEEVLLPKKFWQDENNSK